MEVKGLISALRSERAQIDQAILELERVAQPNSKKTEGLRASVITIIRRAREPERPVNTLA
jgi:hypothetical protein